MRVLIVGPSCNPAHGSTPFAIVRWMQMIQGKADVSFLSSSLRHSIGSRLGQVWTYYPSCFPKPDFKEKVDLVQIHNPHLWAIGNHFPGIPKILFEHDIHWNLLQYDLVHSPSLKKIPFKKLWRPWFLWRAAQFEKKALKEASHIFVYSETDKNEILKRLPQLEEKITAVPNFLDPSRYPIADSVGDIVLFMGTLDYSPNQDAVQIICQELAPRLPHLPFKIVGSGSIRINTIPKNVAFLGFVPDVLPYLKRARIFICPLRFGSGTRFKILEALASERPVVSTPKGVEGLEVTHGLNIWIEKDLRKFAEAIDYLWHHPQEALALGRQGRKFIEERHDYKKCSGLVFQVYQDLLNKKSLTP